MTPPRTKSGKEVPRKSIPVETSTPPNEQTTGTLNSKEERQGLVDTIPSSEVSEQMPSKDFPVVGVGASAGGLDAFRDLLRALPANTGMAFVLVQHMDPSHESMLNTLLSRETKMKVVQVSDGMEVEPNRVYIIPPNTHLSISKGILHLEARPGGSTRHMPIDHFFYSLAQDQKSLSIGIILSGIGSDGTLGLKAIKAEGGITFAQDESSAKFPGMPASALASGAVDFVLPVRKIVEELTRTGRHPYFNMTKVMPVPPLPGEQEDGNLSRILRLLRSSTGVDFSHYKPSTIRRRVARRMILQKCQNLSQYVRFMEDHPSEPDALFEDILIHVTNFFREPEVFEVLKQKIFPKIVANLSQNDPMRFWVPGCSSGEEAYSLAMAISEFLVTLSTPPRVQIFGTDISSRNIEKARIGIYTEASIAEVGHQRLRRFFAKVEGGYQVNKVIRDMCVFARHDLAKDPPFSKLELISCRNVLIYLGPTLQRRVMSVFHYALKPGGYLLLGKSETISAYSNLFSLEDRKHKIYSRKNVLAAHPIPDLAAVGYDRPPIPGVKAPSMALPFDLRREAERILLDRYAPPGILLDANFQILHFQGDTGPFLKPTSGEPSFDLIKMIRPELGLEVRKAVLEAKKTGARVRRESAQFEYGGSVRRVTIEVLPVKERQDEKFDFLVLFLDSRRQEGDSQSPAAGARSKYKQKNSADEQEIRRLRAEVESTREYLRSITEDYEASNEELRAANEEILSSNEELQSTNEELETAKEELQSANEELTTLNEELHNRNSELTHLANDLSNLLVGVEIPIVILGPDHRIRRFTPAAERMLNLIPADVGRPITNIKPNIDLPSLGSILTEASQKKEAVEREVQDNHGKWYALRVRPYTSAEGDTEAILMALVDIDSAKRASAAVVETMRDPLMVLDSDCRVITANRAFYETFHLKREAVENESLFEIGGGDWDDHGLRKHLTEALGKNIEPQQFEFQHDFRAVGRKILLLNARQLQREGKGIPMLLVVIEDLTEKEAAQQQLLQNEEWMRSSFENSVIGMTVIAPKDQFMKVNPAYCRFTGYTEAELRGMKVWDVVFPADKRVGEGWLKKALSADSIQFEARFRHKSGKELWGLVNSVSIRDEAGRPLYVNGQVLDITQQKRFQKEKEERERALRESENKLRHLAGQLISQREEITRMVARETHDVFGQSLVSTGMKLSELEGKLSSNPRDLRRVLHACVQEVQALAQDIHEFARRIHPAALEELGLETALRSECISFSKQYGIRTQCAVQGLPKRTTKDVQLCVFRIVQESLRNVAKHSKAKQVQINVKGNRKEILVQVQDNGVGFDRTAVRSKRGLGLFSMEERARIAGGELKVRSEPGKYTIVEARIPLRRRVKRQDAAFTHSSGR